MKGRERSAEQSFSVTFGGFCSNLMRSFTPLPNALAFPSLGPRMIIYLLIALGGAIGSVARHWLSEVVNARWDGPFPWGTFLVNITGCIAIGFLATLTGPGGRFATGEARYFFMTGVCGGYTTFSAFSLQTLVLIRTGDTMRAAGYVVGSVLICLLGTWLGFAAGSTLAASR
ncbi:MAG: crcB [Verrucomicrobia bacterium]|nr:crcB [Verrucomicrobiota bacterium]